MFSIFIFIIKNILKSSLINRIFIKYAIITLYVSKGIVKYMSNK